MNNEPVAWINKGFDGDSVLDWYKDTRSEKNFPLYTHPAKTEDEPNWKEMYWEMHELNHKHWSELNSHPAKTLTEMEILKTCYECGITRNEMISGLIDDDHMITFARAILRKASEK